MNCRLAVKRLVKTGLAALGATLLSACASPPAGQAYAHPDDGRVTRLLDSLLPTSALLLGEQHDAPEHQAVQHAVAQALHDQGRLAALVLEMAEQGWPDRALPSQADEADVRAALNWSDAWPWAAYGPVVMAAVRAGVPVMGGNLPRSRMREAMANSELDALLAPAALAQQRENIRLGHCNLLPASQIAPMTRVQIARDQALAQTVVQAIRAHSKPDQTVLLIAGHGHVRRDLGIPAYLPAGLSHKVLMTLTQTPAAARAELAGPGAQADAVWGTPARTPRDHCADMVPPENRPAVQP